MENYFLQIRREIEEKEKERKRKLIKSLELQSKKLEEKRSKH